jgi:hypothetical protein
VNKPGSPATGLRRWGEQAKDLQLLFANSPLCSVPRPFASFVKRRETAASFANYLSLFPQAFIVYNHPAIHFAFVAHRKGLGHAQTSA